MSPLVIWRLADLEHLLDGEPGCECCEDVGTHVLRVACGCSGVECWPCVTANLESLAEMLREFSGIRCSDCGADVDGERVSDVATVIPL